MTRDRQLSRFYQLATAESEGQYFSVRLDGKKINTPAGNELLLPSLIMAESVAAEWQNQKSTIDVLSMPLMQLASTAIDRVSSERCSVLKQLVQYGGSDLLCYRATSPNELVEAQVAAWQPILDWLATELEIRLIVTSEINYLEQDIETLHRIHQTLALFGDFNLTAVLRLTQIFNSLALALAVTKDKITWEEGYDLGFLDETYQARRWGEDQEAAERLNNLKSEARMAARFQDLCDCVSV